MTYQKDLTPDTYHGRPQENVLAFGWLDKDYPFDTGETDPSVLLYFDWLLEGDYFRGFHMCEFCTEKDTYGRVPNGNGSYRILDPRSGITYVAPVLVKHYIEKHQYLIPNEVEETILYCIGLGDKDPNIYGGRLCT